MMRYSYLELYVFDDADAMDVRYGADNDYEKYYASKLSTAKEGIRFYFEDQDELTMRMGYIRIPEEHYLFNYGILENAQALDNLPFTSDQYKAIENYARKHLAKAGIPMTMHEARSYDDENQ